MKKFLKIFLICVCCIVLTIILALGSFLTYASITTLKVKDVEEIEAIHLSDKEVNKDEEISILTWNIGYGCLGEKADFYMDGGTQVRGESEEIMRENISAITSKILEINPDITFMQEIDLDSYRSFYVNQLELINDAFKGQKYDDTFACNYKAGFVPIPLYEPMGRVNAGIGIFTKFEIEGATRVQLPIPFKWPVNLFNLKRCLLVNRINISGSDKQLVLICFHLEAYDDGAGKEKQLKQMMDIIDEEYNKGNYVIAGGDFNQTISSINYEKYPKMNDWVCPVIEVEKYPNCTFRMDDSTPTCRSLYKPYYNSDKENHQYYMIDGFVVSKNVTIDTFETLNLGFVNSDHNPVYMKFRLI